MKTFALLSLVLTLTGCIPLTLTPVASSPPSVVGDSAEYAPFVKGGDGVLVGQAFMKTRGGEVKVAAGNTVYLDPVTRASTAWWEWSADRLKDFDAAPDDSLFKRGRRKGTVDAQGRFRFAGLAPGDYYVRTFVTWEIGGYYSTQGGVLSSRATVKDGDNEIVLTR